MGVSKYVLACTLIFTCLPVPCLADVSEAVHVLNGNEIFSPISENQVAVFVSAPSVPLKIIGSIEAKGMAQSTILDELTFSAGPGEKEDMALAIAALKREAASIGANGVIITQQAQVRLDDGSTERRISATAIRY